MRVLLDQGIARCVEAMLTNDGMDVVHVGRMGLAHASDLEIIEAARTHGRVIVTHDADFHDHLALSGATNPSVVRLRREGLSPAAVAMLIREVVVAAGKTLAEGALITIDAAGARVRRLPIEK